MTDFTALFAGVAKGDDWGPAFDALLARLTEVTNALEGANVTSTSSVSIGTGTKTFTTDQTATAVPLAGTVRAYSAADPSKFMVGAISSFSGTTLKLAVTLSAGSGSAADWVIGYEVAVALAGNATGAIDMAGNLLTADELRLELGAQWLFAETEKPDAVSGAQALTLVESLADRIHINGTTALTVTAGAATNYGTGGVLLVEQDTSGGRAFTISGATWIGGTAKDFSGQDPNYKTLLGFYLEPSGTVLVFPIAEGF